jgi:hypothetical protein
MHHTAQSRVDLRPPRVLELVIAVFELVGVLCRRSWRDLRDERLGPFGVGQRRVGIIVVRQGRGGAGRGGEEVDSFLRQDAKLSYCG